MDGAGPSARPRRHYPAIPPNYVSLRHLRELRLEEEEEEQQQQQEVRRRREEQAAVGRVEEKEAPPQRETKAWSDTSGEAKARPFGPWERQWVAVAHRSPRLPVTRWEGAAEKKDGAVVGDRARTRGSSAAVYSRSQGGGGKADNKGEGKLSTCAKGEPATVTMSPHGGKPEGKMEGKQKPSGGQSTASGANGAPRQPATVAASASPRGRVRPENNRYGGKKGSGGRSTETATASSPGETAAASPPQGVKPETEGKKPSMGRHADAAPTGGSPEGKRAQPAPAAEGRGNRRSGGGGVTTTSEAKAESPWGKQLVVEVKGAAGWNPWVARTPISRRPDGGQRHGSTRQHGGGATGVWMPKAAAASPGSSQL